MRRRFVQLLTAGSLTTLSACGISPNTQGRYEGKVLVIGAGAAGMSAAWFLKKANVDVTVLEASGTYGGRIKTARDFVDFPIPLGGEWLHTTADELNRLTGSESHGIEMAAYAKTESYGLWANGKYNESEVEASKDLKFVGRTWLDVFEDFFLPDIASIIRYNSVVSEIDYRNQSISVTTLAGDTFNADKVIVTVPLVQLRDNLTFTPSLPEKHQSALDNAAVYTGFKAFFEFDQRFYPDALEFEGRNNETGQHLYYNASYGQKSNANVLGLFTVGSSSEPYQLAHRRNELEALVLEELDPLFYGKPSSTYKQHIAQDWGQEPFIGMAYLSDRADWRIPKQLSKPIEDRIFFAGDAYIDSHEGWSMVHLAARAGRVAVDKILS